jgi:hypothetical protein
VAFQKTYGDELRPDSVFDIGTIRAGGDEIEGEWTIPGEWSGTFLMVSPSSAGEAVERKVSEEVR